MLILRQTPGDLIVLFSEHEFKGADNTNLYFIYLFQGQIPYLK